MSALLKQLIARNKDLELIVANQQKLLDKVVKNQEAQGEMIAQMSCKLDELSKKRREDEDDDPSAPKDSELPSSSKQLGVQAQVQGESTTQGESSSQPGAVSEKAPAESSEKNKALLDFEATEESIDTENLEEGELVADDDVDEHVFDTQSTDEVFLQDTDGVQRIDVAEVRKAADAQTEESTSEESDMEETWAQRKERWFKKIEKPEELSYKRIYDVTGTREPKKGIICWLVYDPYRGPTGRLRGR